MIYSSFLCKTNKLNIKLKVFLTYKSLMKLIKPSNLHLTVLTNLCYNVCLFIDRKFKIYWNKTSSNQLLP